VQLYAFDVLALDGAHDLREHPLSTRKARLERLLARTASGIFLSTFEQARLGLTCFAMPVRWAGSAIERSAAPSLQIHSPEYARFPVSRLVAGVDFVALSTAPRRVGLQHYPVS
jgi:hypothetical protein